MGVLVFEVEILLVLFDVCDTSLVAVVLMDTVVCFERVLPMEMVAEPSVDTDGVSFDELETDCVFVPDFCDADVDGGATVTVVLRDVVYVLRLLEDDRDTFNEAEWGSEWVVVGVVHASFMVDVPVLNWV